QATLDKSAPGHRMALANYYGFDNGLWPVDGDGVLHLLGDGNFGSEDHILDLIANADDAVDIRIALGLQHLYWAEVVVAHNVNGDSGPSLVYREITDEQAAAF